MKSKNDKYLNNSLINGMKILDAFEEQDSHLTSKQISEKLNLNSSSTWRLIYTLQHLGYLEQIPDSDEYMLASKMLKFARIILNNIKLRGVAKPYIEDLVADLKLNSNLTILENNKSILILRIPSPEIPDTHFHVGREFPLYCSSSGKILLANIPEDQLKKILQDLELKKLTSKTITDKKKLYDNLMQIKEQGYAVDNGEYIKNTNCIAVPIHDSSGKVIASLSVSNRQLNESQKVDIKNCLNSLSTTAKKISYNIGYGLYNPMA